MQRYQLTLNVYNNIQIDRQNNEFTLNAQKKNQFNRSERINYNWVRPMQPIWKAEKKNEFTQKANNNSRCVNTEIMNLH